MNRVVFGPAAPGLYPMLHAPTGFLKIRAEVLARMIDGTQAAGMPLGVNQGNLPVFLAAVRCRRTRWNPIPHRRLQLLAPTGADRYHADGRHHDQARPLQEIRIQLRGFDPAPGRRQLHGRDFLQGRERPSCSGRQTTTTISLIGQPVGVLVRWCRWLARNRCARANGKSSGNPTQAGLGCRPVPGPRVEARHSSRGHCGWGEGYVRRWQSRRGRRRDPRHRRDRRHRRRGRMPSALKRRKGSDRMDGITTRDCVLVGYILAPCLK